MLIVNNEKYNSLVYIIYHREQFQEAFKREGIRWQVSCTIISAVSILNVLSLGWKCNQ